MSQRIDIRIKGASCYLTDVGGGWWYLWCMYVDIPYRNQGKARRVMRKAVRIAKARGFGVYLDAAPYEQTQERLIAKASLVKFYESVGFVVHKRIGTSIQMVYRPEIQA